MKQHRHAYFKYNLRKRKFLEKIMMLYIVQMRAVVPPNSARQY